MRTGSVCMRTSARKSEISSSSNEVRKANSAAEASPGAASGTTMRVKMRQRLAPRLAAARSRFTSTPLSVESRISTTTGSAITAWQKPSHSVLPIRPTAADMKYMAIAVTTEGTIIGISSSDSTSVLARRRLRTSA